MEGVLILVGCWFGCAVFMSLMMALMSADDNNYELRTSRRIVMWAWAVARLDLLATCSWTQSVG